MAIHQEIYHKQRELEHDRELEHLKCRLKRRFKERLKQVIVTTIVVLVETRCMYCSYINETAIATKRVLHLRHETRRVMVFEYYTVEGYEE
jgi:hypothetical protein